MSGEQYADDNGLESLVDDLVRQVEQDFGATAKGEHGLNVLVALSSICSAVFFYMYGGHVFAGIWPPAAWALTLACGLLPTEYAYLCWRDIRKNKTAMTRIQLTSSSLGIAVAVGFAVVSTIALMVAGFPDAPADIKAYIPWLSLICIAAPLPLQFALLAMFELGDRVVVENFARARAHAVRFGALMHFNMAKVAATLIGMKKQLARELRGYGDVTGERGAARLLGREGSAPTGAAPKGGASLLDDNDIASLIEERPSFFARFRRRHAKQPESNDNASAHDALRHNAVPIVAEPSGQGGLSSITDDDMKRFIRLLREVQSESTPAAPSAPGQGGLSDADARKVAEALLALQSTAPAPVPAPTTIHSNGQEATGNGVPPRP